MNMSKLFTSKSKNYELFLVLVPAIFSCLQLYYIQNIYLYFYILSETRSAKLVFLAVIPLLISEFLATKFWEASKYGWTNRVKAAFFARCVILFGAGLIFFWYPVKMKDSAGLIAPLIWRWVDVVRISWEASIFPASFFLIFILFFYYQFTVKRRLFRFVSTLFIPFVATVLLFSLLYFNPTSFFRTWNLKRPSEVESVFPKENSDFKNKFLPQGDFFPHDLYVEKNDAWAMFSNGPTFRSAKDEDKLSFLWINLKNLEFQAFLGGQIRRFYSECSDKFYFSPWHKSVLFEYAPGSKTFKNIDLPGEVAGEKVKELFSVYHDCQNKKVYVANNINPALFVLSSLDNKLEKSLSLVGKNGIRQGSHIFAVKRNPFRKTIILSMYPKYSLIELDEKTLAFKNKMGVIQHRCAYFDVVVSSDGKYLYAPAIFRKQIMKFNAETFELVKKIKSEPHCRKLVFSKDGRWLFAVSYLTGKVLIYDVESDSMLTSFYVTPRAETLYATDKYLYIAGAEGLFRISNEALNFMVQ
ncbi:MAG: WD40 repeat domain-containing protein, partial [Elusimicrobiales bacterium]|nr:WD40 repeat domain-containing protein [Elusimicrobiales bacterium]